MDKVAALPTLSDLFRFVHKALCDHDALDPGQAPLEPSLVVRKGRACGIFFQVAGPRLMKVYAIWAGEENRLLFYDAKGARFDEVQLSEAPDPASLKKELRNLKY